MNWRIRSWVAWVTAAALFLSACAPTSQVNQHEERVTELESGLDGLVRENGELARRVSDVESAVGLMVEAFAETNGQSDLSSDIDQLRLEVERIADLTNEAVDVTAGLASCVNDYMDTIARWSSNVSSRYSYFYC